MLSLSSSEGLKERSLASRNGSWDSDEFSKRELKQLLEAGPSGQPWGGAGVQKANLAHPHRHLLTALHHPGNCFSWHPGVVGQVRFFSSKYSTDIKVDGMEGKEK